MNADGLVEVPENALVEERIAFGLAAPQLTSPVATGGVEITPPAPSSLPR